MKSDFLLFWVTQIEDKSSRDQVLNLFEQKIGKTFFDDNFYSHDILFKICEKFSENKSDKILKYFEFVEEKNNLDFLKTYISGKNSENQNRTILFKFSKRREATTVLVEFLNWLQKKFDMDFLENFLLQVDKNGDSFLTFRSCSYNYFTEIYNHLIQNLEKTFVRKLLLIENAKGENYFYLSCKKNPENIMKMFELLLKDFQNDREFLTKMILSKNKAKQTIFHHNRSGWYNRGSGVLPALKFVKEKINLDFQVDEILFDEDKGGESVFSNLFAKVEEKDFYFDFFDFVKNYSKLTEDILKTHFLKAKFLLFSIVQIKDKSSRDQILNWFEQKFGKTFFDENFYSRDILCEIFEEFAEDESDQILTYFEFVEEKKNLDFLKTYILEENPKTILFYFHYSEPLIKTLKWLKEKFEIDMDFLKDFLLQVDENKDSFFTFILKKPPYFGLFYCFTEIYNFLIETFGKIFISKFLLIENSENENFLNIICTKRENSIVIKVLDHLFKNFQNDSEFFKKLINEKLRENMDVKNWIKNQRTLNFSFDLAEEMGE
jgi:hypothetical protein